MEVTYSDITLDSMLDTWSGYRLHYPERIAAMEQSLRQEGQLQPVIVRSYEGQHQLVDGFKRYYASQKIVKTDALIVQMVDSARYKGLKTYKE